MRAVCASNIGQNIKVMHLHAKDNNGKAWDSDPKDDYGLTMRRFKSETVGYDMRRFIAPYVSGKDFNTFITDDAEDLPTWSCPAIGAPAIDHKDNTRTWTYMGLTYFPGNKWPFAQMTHEDIDPNWDRLPLYMSELANFVVQQDNTTDNSGTYEFNHGSGELGTLVKDGTELTTNPSFTVKKCSSKKSIKGSIMGYGDGSVVWKYIGALQDVGQFHRSISSKRLFSLPPR